MDTNRVELFSKHLARVISICKKYDFDPMIWSDMYFRLNSKNGGYYREEPLPESTLKMIPENIKLVYWDYYNTDQAVYDRMNKYHKQTNREVIFAGGSWRWKGYTPAIGASFKTSIPAIKSAVENEIKFVIVTAWGDNGDESSIMNTLPIMCLYSTADYFQSYDDEKVNSLLKAVTEENLTDMLMMDLPDMPGKKALYPAYNPSKYFLFQDPMNGLFDYYVKKDYASNYLEYAKNLFALSKKSQHFGYVYDTLAKLCDALSMKVDLGVKLRKAYKENKGL